MIEWTWRSFAELTLAELYEILRSRQDVFILEQTCLYPDADGLDQDAHHLLGWHVVDGKRRLAAYLRCMAPGAKYAEMSLGRVLTTSSARGGGVGRQLLEQGIAHAERQYPGHRIRIEAQAHLTGFYGGFGFVAQGEPFIEDGIPHIDMLR